MRAESPDLPKWETDALLIRSSYLVTAERSVQTIVLDSNLGRSSGLEYVMLSSMVLNFCKINLFFKDKGITLFLYVIYLSQLEGAILS